MDTMPTATDWLELALGESRDETLSDQKAAWDAMAPRYAHKRRRSGYLSQLLELLDLGPSESVFDMGCGPGVLTVPLAQSGHEVYAVDFSDGMLAELERAVQDAEVHDRVRAFQRAWQDDWSDLPQADVALSSRSMTTNDIADAVAKLESKARRRVVVTTAAGESPWCDLRLRQALGRNDTEIAYAGDFVILLNYLLQIGRFPEIAYITYSRRPASPNLDELKAFMRKSARIAPEEQERFDSFIAQHLVEAEDGSVQMDYEQLVRWAVLSWDVP